MAPATSASSAEPWVRFFPARGVWNFREFPGIPGQNRAKSGGVRWVRAGQNRAFAGGTMGLILRRRGPAWA